VLAAVAAFGCDYAQGYHFSRPVNVDAFTAWTRERAIGAVVSA
jgi:EAL domain-containing protein (putative c-di-GMP-specific phosphodiesterase class I)